MLESHINREKKGGKGYYTGDGQQPIVVREIKHFEDKKVVQIFCTSAGFKFLLNKVPSNGTFTLALPDNTIFIEAQSRLLSVELRCFWFAYRKLKRGSDGDILRIKLENFLKILDE